MAKEWTVWTGRQWSVTSFGILNNEDEYDIPADALGMLCSDGVTPLWVEQVARKVAVDLDDFLDAFFRATRIHAGKFRALPEGWQKFARSRVAKAKAIRAVDAKIKEKLGGVPDPDGGVYPDHTLGEYWAAAEVLFGKEWVRVLSGARIPSTA